MSTLELDWDPLRLGNDDNDIDVESLPPLSHYLCWCGMMSIAGSAFLLPFTLLLLYRVLQNLARIVALYRVLQVDGIESVDTEPGKSLYDSYTIVLGFQFLAGNAVFILLIQMMELLSLQRLANNRQSLDATSVTGFYSRILRMQAHIDDFLTRKGQLGRPSGSSTISLRISGIILTVLACRTVGLGAATWKVTEKQGNMTYASTSPMSEAAFHDVPVPLRRWAQDESIFFASATFLQTVDQSLWMIGRQPGNLSDPHSFGERGVFRHQSPPLGLTQIQLDGRPRTIVCTQGTNRNCSQFCIVQYDFLSCASHHGQYEFQHATTNMSVDDVNVYDGSLWFKDVQHENTTIFKLEPTTMNVSKVVEMSRQRGLSNTMEENMFHQIVFPATGSLLLATGILGMILYAFPTSCRSFVPPSGGACVSLGIAYLSFGKYGVFRQWPSCILSLLSFLLLIVTKKWHGFGNYITTQEQILWIMYTAGFCCSFGHFQGFNQYFLLRSPAADGLASLACIGLYLNHPVLDLMGWCGIFMTSIWPFLNLLLKLQNLGHLKIYDRELLASYSLGGMLAGYGISLGCIVAGQISSKYRAYALYQARYAKNRLMNMLRRSTRDTSDTATELQESLLHAA